MSIGSGFSSDTFQSCYEEYISLQKRICCQIQTSIFQERVTWKRVSCHEYYMSLQHLSHIKCSPCSILGHNGIRELSSFWLPTLPCHHSLSLNLLMNYSREVEKDYPKNQVCFIRILCDTKSGFKYIWSLFPSLSVKFWVLLDHFFCRWSVSQTGSSGRFCCAIMWSEKGQSFEVLIYVVEV